MVKSIKHFEGNSIKIFEKLEDDFMKNPTKLAEYIYDITDEFHRLGLQMIRESLESIYDLFLSVSL